MGTHYGALGVSATADTSTIRAAYLAKARVHHPDRNLDAPAAARARSAGAMREANAAWAVLGDASARREYDSSLAAMRRVAAPRAAPRPAAPASSQPYRVAPPGRPPWTVDDEDLDLHGRLGCSIRVLPTIAIFVLLLGIFVFTAFASTKSDEAPGGRLSSYELLAGDCVLVGAVFDPVPCTAPHDAEVVSIVGMARGCPAGTAVYAIDVALVACLRPVP